MRAKRYRLQPRRHVLRLPHGLADREVRHDLLAAPQDGLELEAPLELLDDEAHARGGDGPAPEDLAGVVADDGGHARLLVLEQGDGPGKVPVDVLGAHVVHLVRQVFQQAVHRLNVCRHLGELVADHGLLDQRLPEDLAGQGPPHALVQDHARVAIAADHHAPTLEVEVGHGL